MTTPQQEITRLHATSAVKTLETIAVMFGVIFFNLLLPAVMLKYIYDPTTLVAQPAALELLPIIGFVIGAAHLLYTLFGNFNRGRRIAQLERSMNSTARGNMYDLRELSESMASTTTAPAKARSASKTTKSKTTRKSSTRKKKTATKK